MSKLNQAYKIHILAADLGLDSSTTPVASILQYCERITRRFVKEFPTCDSPAKLLEVCATRLGTRFEIITTDKELVEVQQRYVTLGEKGFARLDDELNDDVYGITFRRQAKKPWEPEFVSVIDARGDKQFRANYTKWHELGHLFILTDQLRLTFTRTSCNQDLKDPEESLVDVIAGHFAFWAPLFHRHISGPINFDAVERVRATVCPEASKTSALLGLVKLWPRPCVLVEARLGLKKQERLARAQANLGFLDAPTPVLRLGSVTINESAQEAGLQLHRQWRVPAKSIISRVFQGEPAGIAKEDLSWWTTSGGGALRNRSVHVDARRSGDAVQALITPAD